MRDKLERMKFKCPDHVLPHNLSSIEVDQLLSLFKETIEEAKPEKMGLPKEGVYKEKELDNQIAIMTGYDSGIDEFEANLLAKLK